MDRQSQEWVSQQWWERKATAYTQIIEAIWQSLEYSRDYLAYEYGELRKSVDEQAEKFDNFSQNQLSLIRTADIGAFIISDEASEALQSYFKTTRNAADWDSTVDIAENHLEAGEKCLKSVKEAAMKDLRIKRPASPDATPNSRPH